MERERNGVRLGMRVRDVDGRSLGRVKRLYEAGFAARKGLPLLIGQDAVVLYDEVRAIEGGAVTVARSASDLLVLAAGGVPRSWRVSAPRPLPRVATPAEAHGFAGK